MQRLIDFFARRFLVLYFVVAAVLLFGMLRPAHAMSGNRLLSECTSNENANQLACIMYVSGLMDMGAGAFFCPPPTATYAQAKDMLVKALREVPEVRDKGADILTIELFSKVWPCQRQQQPGRAPI
jgi:hypothetical protein